MANHRLLLFHAGNQGIGQRVAPVGSQRLFSTQFEPEFEPLLDPAAVAASL